MNKVLLALLLGALLGAIDGARLGSHQRRVRKWLESSWARRLRD